MGIRIVAINGSARPGNFTGKAFALAVDEIRGHAEVELEIFLAEELRLSFPGEPATTDAQRLKKSIEQATGVLLATPEYHGTMSSMAKLIIENLGFPSVLAGKPMALLGVAAGEIGAIKALEHLRSVCSHIGAVVLPGVVSVARVQSVFDAQGKCIDAKIEKRVRGVATHLLDYIHNNICPKVALEQMVRGG